MADLIAICSVVLLSILCIEATCIDLDKSQSRCYSHQSSLNRFYGTKTTYSVAKAALDSSLADEPQVPANCQPVMLYFVGRHAIRYPDGEDIVEMSQVLSVLKKQIITASEKGLTQLCEQDLNSIRNWELKMNATDDNRISDTGVRETKRIAKAFKRRYPSLLDSNNVNIEVGITTKERTEQTADAFVQEIQLNDSSDTERITGEDGSSSSDSSDEEVLQRELKPKGITKSEKPFLRFHDTCKDLLLEQGVRLEKPKRIKDLRKSELMLELVRKLNERLGFGEDYKIDLKVLRHIVRACYFEFAIHEQNSGWCSLLTDEEHKLLEYLDDMEDFYEDAYGRDINAKQSCPLIADLFDKVKQSMQNSNEKKTYLYFSHAGLMKRLYSGLGLFDKISDNIDEETKESVCLNDDRKWKTSLVCPFGANFAVILHKCSKEKRHKRDDSSEEKSDANYKLLTLVQEKPVRLKGCDSHLCSAEKFIKAYKQIASNCDLQKICRI